MSAPRNINGNNVMIQEVIEIIHAFLLPIFLTMGFHTNVINITEDINATPMRSEINKPSSIPNTTFA